MKKIHPLFWISILVNAGALLTLFLLFFEIYGFIFLCDIAAQLCLSTVFSGTGICKKKNAAYYFLCVLSRGVPFILNFIIYAERKNAVSLSAGLMAVLGAYALAVLALLYVWFFFNIKYFLIVVAVNCLLSLVILALKRDAHCKIFWISAIFVLPGMGALLYLFSSGKIYFGVFRARCKKFDRLHTKYFTDKNEMRGGIALLGQDGSAAKSAGESGKEAAPLRYFTSGGLFFADVLQSLQAAKEYIYLEFFIYDEGGLADDIFGILNKKAVEGVKVYVIYDDFGGCECYYSGRFKRAREAGVRFCPFNTMPPFLNPNINYRDHRKIVVVDGLTAYTGGVNVGDEYLESARSFGYWKDCGAKTEGAAAADFAYLFERTWFALSKERIGGPQKAQKEAERGCVVFGGGLEYGRNALGDIYLNLIGGAESRIALLTPYFMPGAKITGALAAAAERGVDVTVYLPYIPDKFYVHLVSRLNGERLLKHGVKVKYTYPGFLHSKVLLCDKTACVGTANFDYRSLYMQQECGVISADSGFVSEIESDVAALTADCIEAGDGHSLFKNKFRTFLAYLYGLISYLF